MIVTATAEVELSAEGIVIARIAAGVTQSVDDARANLDAAVMARAGKRRPILVDISKARPLQAEVRRHYMGPLVVDSFAALALVIEASPVGRMMGNIYFRVARLGLPTRLFGDVDSAMGWLREHRLE